MKQKGGNNSNVSNSIAVDASENIYIAGYFSGTVDFDPGSATYSLSSASANSDIFINKFDANGSLIWAKKMGSTYSDGACAVAVDLGGNIFTTGYFGTGCDFDPNAGFAYKNTYGTGDLDVFINKLDPSGNHIWTKQMGGTSNDYPDNIALDGTGNVYISGRFEGVGYFNPSALTYTIASSGPGDFFFSKFDANGNFVWANAMGCNLSSLEQANSIAVNNAGDFFATGQFSGTTDFDPSSAIFSLTVPSPASYNCFVLQMNQCLTPPAAPLNTTPAASLHICSGTSASFSATSNGTIKWYATPTSTLVLSTGQLYVAMLTAGIHIYYAEAVTCTVSASRTAITVTVDPTCADVWPGDANSDGTADNLDVLELGLHYSQTGPARATTSNSWQSCFSNNWSGTITNGKNLNHSDCNGDGVIDDNDTLAVYNNYGLAHSFKPNQQTVTNPQLSIVPDQAAVVKGNWGSASIYLGDSGSPISGINGIAFTVNFDNALIEANSVWIEYPSSFINASNQNLNFRKLDFAANNLYTATTHTITNNVSGNGLIATLHYQIKSSLATDEVLNLGIVQGYKSDGLGAIMPLTAGTGTLMAMGASVGLNEVAAGNRIGISPNPAQSSVLISSTSDLEKVEVLNLTGQVLISELAGEKAHHLNIEPLANGVYFIKVYNSSKQFMLKKLVIQK